MEEKNHLLCAWCITYNHSAYINQTLKSFCEQKTTFPVVYLVIDDASTDGEKEIIEQFVYENFNTNDSLISRREETDNYVFIYAQHKYNRNCYIATYFLKYNHYQLNKSKDIYIEKWTNQTKYSAICEGDDYWIDPLKLQKQVDLLENNPNVGLIHTDCDFLYQKTGEYVSAVNAHMKYDMSQQTDISTIIDGILLGKYKIRTPSVVYRNSTYRKMKSSQDKFLNSGYFPMTDIQLWIGMAQCSNIMYLPESMVVYRVTEGTMSRPQGYYKYIYFLLTMRELRIFYNQKFGYISDEIKKIINEYTFYLKTYREFDSSYTGILPIENLYDNGLQHIIFKIKNNLKLVKYNISKYFYNK